MRLYFLVFFFAINSYSQKVLIDDVGDLKNISVDSIHNELLLFYNGYFDKFNLKTLQKERIDLKSPNGFDITKFNFIAVDSVKFFVSSDGGLVYRFQKDTLIRIDNSFEHRMQTGSNLFCYDSKIYRYGGYGFWSVRNFFIYFDHKTHEWEVNDLIKSEEIPDGTYDGNFILKNDDIYLFGGLKIDPYKQLERIINNEVWKYNFKDHKWFYLGKNDPVEKGVRIKYKNKILIAGMSNLAEIDVLHNKITFYQHNLVSPKLSKNFKSFYLNNNFYCFIDKRGKISLKIMKEADFFKRKISSKIFYKNYNNWAFLFLIYFLIPVFVLVLGWLGFNYYKKTSKIILLENGLRFKNKFIEFDPESMSIIKTLLSEEEVYSNKILRIVEKKQYSPAHNERIKMQKLNDINLKIKMLLETDEDVIRSVKSKLDKRIKIYIINKEYFNTKELSRNNLSF